jgi:hypothetical protein
VIKPSYGGDDVAMRRAAQEYYDTLDPLDALERDKLVRSLGEPVPLTVLQGEGPPIGATLAFRNGESRRYTSELPESAPNLYAVALIGAHLPWETIQPSSLCIVACAEYTTWKDGEGWGWTHLDPDTKYAIGHDLEEMGARPDQWYYLVLGEAVAVTPTCTPVN